MRAVFAIIYSDLIRLFRAKAVLASFVLTPLLLIVFLYLFFYSVSPSTTLYLISTFIVLGAYLPAFSAGLTLVTEKEFGTFKEILAAPISNTEIILGRILFSARMIVIFPIILLIASSLLGFVGPELNFNLLFGLASIALTAFYLGCTSLIIALVIERSVSFQSIVALASFPLIVVSNAFLPLKEMPLILKQIVLLNPLTYTFDLLRFSLGLYYEFDPLYSLLILFFVTVLSFVACVAFFRKKFS